MSASFANLENTDYLYYLRKLKFIVFDSRAAREEDPNWHAAIDYSKLKEEINRSCDLFIDKPEYVESLIHRALFYKKPLLRTKEELGLVNELVEEIVTQAKLLKESANSTEFASLINNRDNLQNCNYSTQGARKDKTKKGVIERITVKVGDNLRVSPLVNNHKRNFGLAISTDLSEQSGNSGEKDITETKDDDINIEIEESKERLPVAQTGDAKQTGSDGSGLPAILEVNSKESKQGSDTKCNNTQSSNLGENNVVPQNEKRSKLSIVVASTLAVAGIISGMAIAVYLEMLAVGVAVGACCLVAAAIVYYCNEPSKSLKDSKVAGVSEKVPQPIV